MKKLLAIFLIVPLVLLLACPETPSDDNKKPDKPPVVPKTYKDFPSWNEWLEYKYNNSFGWDAATLGSPGTLKAEITHDMLVEEYFFSKGLNAGWNLGNTYDMNSNPRALAENSRYDKLMAGIKAAGFNVIRIPVTWGSAHQNNTMPALLADVEAAATAAHDAGLVVFINTHHDKSYFNLTNAGPSWKTDGENGADYKTHTARFTGVWTLVAEHFKDFGDWLIFESLNEPTYSSPSGSVSWDGAPPEYHQVINNWNQLFVDLVRDSGGNNAKRYLIFKCYAGKLQIIFDPSNGFVNPVDKAGEGRLIFSFHAYVPQPLGLEGQNTQWSNTHKNSYTTLFKQAQEEFLLKGIQVFMGETGATFHSQRTGDDPNVVGTSAQANRNRLLLLNNLGHEARKYGAIPVLWDNGDATRASNGVSGNQPNGETFAMFKRKPAHDNNPNNYGQPIDHTILPGGNKFPGSVTQGSYAVMVPGNMAANDPDFGKRTLDAFIDALNNWRPQDQPRFDPE